MSTIQRRQRRVSFRQLGPYKRHELLTGVIRYPVMDYYSGYGDGSSVHVSAFISDEMRADWAANRDELLAFWISGKSIAAVFSDAKPWLILVRGSEASPWAERTLSAQEL